MGGIGFQKKSVDQISKELNIIKQQTISMLNKAVRKIYAFIDKTVKDYVEINQVRPELGIDDDDDDKKEEKRVNTNTMFDPMRKLRTELKQIGYKKKKQEKLEMLSGMYDNSIPSSISIEQPSRLVTMPKKQIAGHMDPEQFQSADRAQGINPDSRFHWNKKKKNKKGKKKRKESKVLQQFKEDRNKRKTKHKKTREKYFADGTAL